MKRLVLGIAALVACTVALAEGPLRDDPTLRVGGGFGNAKADNVADTSYIAMVGVDSYQRPDFRTGFEFGGVDVNRSSADAFFATGFFSWFFGPDMNLFARAGVALGADAGVAMGAGVGYFIERNMEVRVETLSLTRSKGIYFTLAFYPNQNAYW